MLPIVLVLFVVAGACAAPSVSVSQVPINQVPPAYDVGGGVNGGLITNLLDLKDGGDKNIYVLTLIQVLTDLGNLRNSYAQAQAVASAIAILGQIAPGIAGDACAEANAISSAVSGRGGAGYLRQLAANIDVIAQLSANPDRLRYTTGARGNCPGGGRNYPLEAAWELILSRANPYTIALENEEYCSVRRLNSAVDARTNNVGAAATAAALPSVVERVQRALGPVLIFLRAAINGNGFAYAPAARQALLS